MTPIVFIQWVDAHNNTGWFTNDEMAGWIDHTNWYSDDVGYLVKETKTMLVFAQRHDPPVGANREEQWGGLHKIPKTWVKSRRILGYLKTDGSFVEKRNAAVAQRKSRRLVSDTS
jgi:hypothetical protein